MKRWLALGLAALALGAPQAAAADGHRTYCVGGFEIQGDQATREQCRTHHDVHPRWHLHSMVSGADGKCRECWDEEDNTCDSEFLHDHSDFHRINGYECIRAGALPPEAEEIRVEDGKKVQTPQPPPPPPVDLHAEIAHVSPGPYALGDDVVIKARVAAPDGTPRAVGGGEIVVVGADGKEQARVPVSVGADGNASASVKIAASGKLTFRFEPRGIKIGANEKLGQVRSSEAAIEVSPCRLRGAVLSPADGELVVDKVPIALRGQLRDNGGASVSQSALGAGTRPVFVIERADGGSQKLDATIDASGAASATLTLAATSDASEVVSIRLLGEGGAGDFCPGAPAQPRLTRLGVGIDIASPPPDAVCYVDKPCWIAADLRLPAGGEARVAALGFVGAPDLEVDATFNQEPAGRLAHAGTDPTAGWTMIFTPRASGRGTLEVSAHVGAQEVRESRPLVVREPIELRLPATLELGSFRAGASWSTTCAALDFSASRGVEEQEFWLQSGTAPGCPSALVANVGGLRYPLPERVKLTLGIERTVSICLDQIPRCAAESPDPVTLTVSAASPDFAEERRSVAVHWTVSGRSFLACNWWWLGLIGGTLFTAFVVYGFVSPRQFGPDDAVRIAAQPQALARAVARRLRELPGGRAGFYRSAATGLRDDGSPTRKLRAASVVFVAGRGEVVLRCRGRLQRVNPQTRKLEEVTGAAEGYPASRTTTYAAGSLHFQVK